MSPVFVKHLPLEYQLLWQASKKKRLENRDISRDLQRRVNEVRNRFKRAGRTDRLSQKLMFHGNAGGWGLMKLREISQFIYQNKRPGMEHLGHWLSVELEVVMKDQAAEAALVTFIRKNGFKDFVTIKDDGSIKMRQCNCEVVRNDEGEEEVMHGDECRVDSSECYGREFVLTFRYGDWEFLKQICAEINRVGCTVNKSCGMHVHFDMRHMASARKMGVLAHRVARVVPALKQMLPASRQNNRFCNTVINKHTDEADGNARYAFVNVKSWDRHKTLEIRGHSGTTDAVKIINWIKILRMVMEKPNRSQIATVEGMIEKFKPDAELQAYMLARQAKFAHVKRQVVDDVDSDNEAFSIAHHTAELPENIREAIARLVPRPSDAVAVEAPIAFPFGGSVPEEPEAEETIDVNGMEVRIDGILIRPAVDPSLAIRRIVGS